MPIDARTTIAVSFLAFYTVLPAQQTTRLKFDVASVKPSKPGVMSWSYNFTPGGFTAENIPLSSLIVAAYHIKPFQLTGGPSWTTSARYDIAGKAEGKLTPEDRMQMVQSLLEDRFQLKLRHETKQHALYALLQAKNGSRLKASPCRTGNGEKCGAWVTRENEISGNGITITQFADALSGTLDLPVIDETGLTGTFDIELKWTPAEADAADAAVALGPSIFTAIQEQLGLRLESQKGPVETLAIEHIERPAEN